MDSNSSKQTSSSLFGKVSSVDVSQLDKINAIPNKTTDNILMDGLSQEDQLYLGALMDNDSSGEDEAEKQPRSSAWSPMVQSPVLMGKRIKKLRPGYAVTLSLEDISYIRPSWGISKGIRTIEVNNTKKQQQAKQVKKEKVRGSSTHDSTYNYMLVILTIVIILIIVPTYLLDKKKNEDKTNEFKIQIINPVSRVFELYRPVPANQQQQQKHLEPVLKVKFAQGIPGDLKPDKCTCDIYNAETGLTDNQQVVYEKSNSTSYCFSCLDWALRANMRVYVEKNLDKDTPSFCYHVKWQSYDSLATPLIDCFPINEEQWLGLGDIQSSLWPLNRLQSDVWTPLVSNLSTEFLRNDSLVLDANQLALGTFVDFSLFSTEGIHISDIRTDFEPLFRISRDHKSGSNQICLSVLCSEKCTGSWTRGDHLEKFRYRNMMLEYKICSAKNMNSLIQRQFETKTRAMLDLSRDHMEKSGDVLVNNATTSGAQLLARLLENESKSQPFALNETTKSPPAEVLVDNSVTPTGRKLPEGIGLIERTIFATSPEFMLALDGQTLRQFVDNIVKLGLKASSILLVDSRWETYAGSLKLNIGMFPKSKLLFEILHNKGFKIVFTIKPYIDTGIGMTSINQLFELGRLYAGSYSEEIRMGTIGDTMTPTTTTATGSGEVTSSLIRRKSLFTFQNQTIEIGPAKNSMRNPYITTCKESQEGHCVLIDLTKASNRAWLIGNVVRSNLLSVEADGIQIGGAHPNSFHWNDHYRSGVSELAKSLFFKEKIFTLPQWTGDFGYIQLAPRSCSWDSLRSVIYSVLDLGTMGFSLIHPGSVWGDLKTANSPQTELNFKSPNRMDSIYGDVQSSLKSGEELIIRWLQVSIFLPILQFNNIAPIERHGIQELVQNLIRIRRLYIVPELKRNLPYTPLISLSKANANTTHLPLIRPVWLYQDNRESVVVDQFTIGSDLLVAPILSEGLRQRDIYLPGGFWHDELRQINLRGGKWLRNYPIEFNEVAWFTRAKR